MRARSIERAVRGGARGGDAVARLGRGPGEGRACRGLAAQGAARTPRHRARLGGLGQARPGYAPAAQRPGLGPAQGPRKEIMISTQQGQATRLAVQAGSGRQISHGTVAT